MDYNFLVIRLIKEIFVVKFNILIDVFVFFFLNLGMFRVRGKLKKEIRVRDESKSG